MNWDEKELEKLGYRKGADGGYYPALAAENKMHNPTSLPKGERNRRSKPTGQNAAQERAAGSFRIVCTSYRQRHSDPDGLRPKIWIDELVKMGLLPDDSSKYVESFEAKVIKVGSKEDESTVIDIYELMP